MTTYEAIGSFLAGGAFGAASIQISYVRKMVFGSIDLFISGADLNSWKPFKDQYIFLKITVYSLCSILLFVRLTFFDKMNVFMSAIVSVISPFFLATGLVLVYLLAAIVVLVSVDASISAFDKPMLQKSPDTYKKPYSDMPDDPRRFIAYAFSWIMGLGMLAQIIYRYA